MRLVSETALPPAGWLLVNLADLSEFTLCNFFLGDVNIMTLSTLLCCHFDIHCLYELFKVLSVDVRASWFKTYCLKNGGFRPVKQRAPARRSREGSFISSFPRCSCLMAFVLHLWPFSAHKDVALSSDSHGTNRARRESFKEIALNVLSRAMEGNGVVRHMHKKLKWPWRFPGSPPKTQHMFVMLWYFLE